MIIYASTKQAVYGVAYDDGYMVTTPEAVDAARRNHEGNSTDPMLQRSAASAAMLEYWDLTDTIIDGIHALRLAGDRYLPRFVDEDNTAYEFRLKMTKVTNVYRDIVEALSSKPFEQEVALPEGKEGETKPPETVLKFIEDVDGSGNNLTTFAATTFFNGINSAIDWISVEFPPEDMKVRSLADAKKAGRRPYWSHILGRNVLDAKSKVIGGEETLTYVKIFEPGKPDRVRVYERLDTGAVTWTLYEKVDRIVDNGKSQFLEVEAGVISIGVIPLVPFVTGRRDGRTWRVFPAMRDAADLQIEVYQQESGLKFAKVLTAYPMLAGNGVKPPMGADGKPIKLAVGPSRVLYAPPDGNGNIGSWAYVEPAAASLKFLAEDIDATISQLRELGRQPLTAQSGNLTVISAAAAAGKARSVVGAWALSLKDALENAMVLTCQWLAIAPAEYDPEVRVYDEFDEFTEGKDLETLTAMRAARDISQITYWDEMKRRSVLSSEFNADEELERLLKEVPQDGEDTTLEDKPDPKTKVPPA